MQFLHSFARQTVWWWRSDTVFGTKKKPSLLSVCFYLFFYIFMHRFRNQELWSLQLEVEEVCFLSCQMKMKWTNCGGEAE